MPESGFDRCKYCVKSYVNQVNPRERNNQTPTQDDAFAQYMIQNINQGELIFRTGVRENDRARLRAHRAPGTYLGRETNE
jgi:hypothetical protein